MERMRGVTLCLAAALVLFAFQAHAQVAATGASPAPAPQASGTPAAAGAPGSTAAAGTAAAAPQPAKEPPVPVPAPEAAAVDLHQAFQQSFFFTPDDLISLHKAIEAQKIFEAGGSVPGVGDPGLKQQVYIPPVRRIRLSAVIYKDSQNWMVWLNNQKVTPTASLPEIMDIKVEKDLVHLKWFDLGANKVLVLTMRPNETYDIVTGVLLPG